MAEKKYLDSEKVIILLRKDLICKYPSTFAHGLWAAADEIAKMDGEDVRPVKRGEWGSDISIATCEHCGHAFPAFMRLYNFCPNCGAEMRESPKK